MATGASPAGTGRSRVGEKLILEAGEKTVSIEVVHPLPPLPQSLGWTYTTDLNGGEEPGLCATHSLSP